MNHLKVLYDALHFDLVKGYVESAVRLYADKDAFVLKEVEDGRTYYRHISFREFGKKLRDFGSGLLKLGLGGKRVAIIAANCYEWLVTYAAVLCGVGIVVPLDKELTETELLTSLEKSRADAVVFDTKHAEMVLKLESEHGLGIKQFISTEKLWEHIPSVNEVAEAGSLYYRSCKDYDNYSPDPDAPASIIFTSGTTSACKAVVLSQRNIASNIYDLLSVESVTKEDRNLLFLPLHHTFGSTGALFFLSGGACCMFCDGLRHIQKNLKEYKITTFVAVPLLLEAMYKNIMAAVEKKGKSGALKRAKRLSGGLKALHIDARRRLFRSVIDELGGSLRLIISGASALKSSVWKGFNDMGITLLQGYGLTETSPVLAAENEKNLRAGSVGKPFPSVEVVIDDPNEDGIGEIVAKGPNVMLGYYEMPEETERVLTDGWFHTGDLGRFDKDGFLYITGRKKNVIVLKSGKNVYPEELEELCMKLPYLNEVLVYGKGKGDNYLIALKAVYDKSYFEGKGLPSGEEDVAAVLKKDVTAINETLPPYKHIKHISLQQTPMAKTTTAKIKRFEELKDEKAEKSKKST